MAGSSTMRPIVTVFFEIMAKSGYTFGRSDNVVIGDLHMTPIERVRIRSEALSTLGVAGNPSQDEIRQAYKDLAKRRHPDAQSGSSDEFQRICDAYRHLLEQPLSPANNPHKVQPRRAARPDVRVTEAEFPEAIVASSRALFDPALYDPSKHVSTGSLIKVRHVVFVVPTRIAEGENLVVVPCAEITDTKRFAQASLHVSSEDLTEGMYRVPAEECRELFPGAVTARIRFAD